MAIREVITVPDPILRRKARKVTDYGKNLQKLIDDMIETMREAPGVGLAAPQVNVSWRVIVIEYGEEDEEGVQVQPQKLYSVVNPEITRSSAEFDWATEGCLSIPDFIGDVERPEAVTIKGFNRHGQPMRVKANGWMARIFQHEIDHLDGILFTDRAEHVRPLEKEPAQVIPAD